MEDSNNPDPYPNPTQQLDPLLQPGAFIDPNPSRNPNPDSNGNGNGNGKCKPEPAQAPQPQPEPQPQAQQLVEQKAGSTGPIDVTDMANRPDWLPANWVFKETLRTSGASAGSKDKYFIDPATNQRFRSKKEVFQYLETGSTPKQLKRKNAKADSENSSQKTPKTKTKTETPKRKKTEAKAKVSMKNFNFDEVPEKVKWELIDCFEGVWRPLINEVDRVPESSKQEWTAAFTYLTLQNGSRE